MPLKLSPAEYVQRAKERYKNGRKTDAFELLLEASRIHPDRTVDFLDISSALHSADGDHDVALQEAHQMMKRYPGNAKGYLRAGKLLQGRGKGKKALSIYKLGLKSVSETDPHAKDLRRARNKLSVEIGPKIDPVSSLPLEVLELIFLYLSYKERRFCLQVSKAWRAALTSTPRLWRDIELISKSKKIRPETVSRLLPRSGPIDGLRIGANFLSKSAKSSILSRSQQLRSFEVQFALSDWKTLTADIISSKFPVLHTLKVQSSDFSVSSDAFFKLLRHIPSLRSLVLPRIALDRLILETQPELPTHGLEALIVSQFSNPNDGMFQKWMDAVLPSTPNIKQLCLSEMGEPGIEEPYQYDFRGLHNLERLICPTFAYPLVPVTLTSLTINKTMVSDLQFDLLLGGDSMPNLQRLHLIECPVLLEALSQMLEIQAPDDAGGQGHVKLTHFRMENCWVEATLMSPHGEDPITEMLRWKPFETLEVLDLLVNPSSSLHDEGILELARHAHNLQRVGLRCSDISGVAVNALVKNCPKLEYLCLDDCRNVPADAINLARSHVREVSSRMTAYK